MLSVSSQKKYNFYHQNTLLDAFRTNSRNIIGRNPSIVIPLLANQDLTPMLHNPGHVPEESATHFSQFISVKVKKISSKSQAQFCEKLRKLKLRQNDGFLIKKNE